MILLVGLYQVARKKLAGAMQTIMVCPISALVRPGCPASESGKRNLVIQETGVVLVTQT